MMGKLWLLGLAFCLGACASETPTAPLTKARVVTSFPARLTPECNDGRARLYDECGSQTAILDTALAEARRSGKTVLINFGAEWCIWCHVFDAHLRGATGRIEYPVERDPVTLVERSGRSVLPDAKALNDYAAAHFVIAHVEVETAPDGWDVMDRTGARKAFADELPFVVTLSADGRFAAVMNAKQAEVRRDNGDDWYRGYDRRYLLSELMRMRQAAGNM